MRLTFAARDSSAAQLVLGRKDRSFKAGVRKIVREHAKEAHAVAHFLCAFRSGRMQRLLRLAFSAAGFAWRLGWRAIDFRREGQPFYAPPVVLGFTRRNGKRQRKQDNLTPAYRHVSGRQRQALITFTRRWARSR